MYFMYDVTVKRPDSDKEFFKGIVDASNADNAKEKITNTIKTMLESTSGEISDDQLVIVIAKLCDVINNTENKMICMSHCDEDPSNKSDTTNNIDCPSVYSENLCDGSYCIYPSATGLMRKFDDKITGLSKDESNAIINDMNYIINHLPDNKNNVAVMGSLAAIAIDFLEAALLNDYNTSYDITNRNLRMIDRRLASLYHTAGNITGKPIRPVGYFYCSSGVINEIADEFGPYETLFTPDNPETVAPRIRLPYDDNVNHVINDIEMSEYEDSLMDAFDEINRLLMSTTEQTTELSACADNDKLTEVNRRDISNAEKQEELFKLFSQYNINDITPFGSGTNRTIELEMLITEHARELDKINNKLKKLKKKFKKCRHK